MFWIKLLRPEAISSFGYFKNKTPSIRILKNQLIFEYF
jgi:hypothetical protein